MIKAKFKYMMLSLLFLLLFGQSVYATKDFFWSDSMPLLPTCTKESSRGGTTGNIGLVTDGKKVKLDIPTCEEAMKSQVLVLVDGKYLHTVAGSGAEPFIEKGRIMIPLRAVADAFGFKVEWKEKEGKITLIKGNRTIILQIGKSEILVDGKKSYFDGAVPMVKNKRTFLPASKLAEILGIQVHWDGERRVATFSK